MAPAATLSGSTEPASAPVSTKQLAAAGIAANTVEQNESVLREIRCLAADLVQQFNGGHPGTAMGAASIGMALWGSVMRFNPADGTWADRDRFVLSAGHACLLQYIYLHLTGYKAWTMDMLKRYHSTDFETSLAAGHPEIDPENGIEVTTGPLGQGIANAVGLAMGSKHMAAHYNKPGLEIVANTVWCFTGDGCIAEGVGVEALSLAGHLGLDNLVLVYDCNKITVDGNIDSYASEDHPAKLKSMGWNVLQVENGSTDVVAIVDALEQAKKLRNGKPTCVQITTIIGYGSKKQDTNPVHGAALGEDDVKHVKRTFGYAEEQKFHLSKQAYDTFASAKTKGEQLQARWNATFAEYTKAFPELARQFEQRNTHGACDELVGGLPKEWTQMLPAKSELPSGAMPTRKASGIVVQALAPRFPQFMVGSADLLDSTFVSWKDMVEFQSPNKPQLGGSFAGRQIRYGIREHAMAAIANGLAGYSSHGFVPVISTFFMFFLYAAPAIRMSALQKLRLIGIATHDSIGIGEDGPTHQPVGLASFFRAVPNVQFMRPADAEEVMGAWTLALEANKTPSILSLSRHALPLLPGSDREAVRRGGYIVHTAEARADATPLTLVATGSEVSLAIEAANILASGELQQSYTVNVVSMPCMTLFDAQPAEYRHSVIPPTQLSVAVEAWASLPWPRYTAASLSMHTFGHSGPQQQLFEMFGFHPTNIAAKIHQHAQSLTRNGTLVLPRIGEFAELLLGYAKGH
jgi:dihydroxyacetone synthase